MDSDWVLKGSFIVSLLKLSKSGLECDIQGQWVVCLWYSVVDLFYFFLEVALKVYFAHINLVFIYLLIFTDIRFLSWIKNPLTSKI